MKTARIIPLLFALCLLCACGQNKSPESADKDSAYASVNGEIVTAAEINYFKSKYRADIINEYAEKYAVTDFSDFWDRDFDGKTPSQELEKRALDEAVSAKIKLVMMRENGVYEDVSFNALLEKANKFNAENGNASGVIGIKTVDIDSFYTYYILTGEMELKNILAESVFKPTADELAAAAERSPDLSENQLISFAVSEKYSRLIAEMTKTADVSVLLR